MNVTADVLEPIRQNKTWYHQEDLRRSVHIRIDTDNGEIYEDYYPQSMVLLLCQK